MMSELGSSALRRRMVAWCLLLVSIHISLWLWAWLVCQGRPLLLSAAWLAYTLGLRHALDADHIAAIDNATRKLWQQRQNPTGTGFFFAMGHSTVVIGLTLAIALGAHHLGQHFDVLKSFGGVVGTCISALFLLLMAVANLGLLAGAWRRVASERALPEAASQADWEVPRGLLFRLLRPLFRFVSKSWHLYPIGVLFGLGFDTATEVALFGLSVSQVASGLSWTRLLILPVLFAAGMSLLDSLDGFLMLGVYRWAERLSRRKFYYDLIITLVSALIAVLIGTGETLQLIADRFDLHGPFWRKVSLFGEQSIWIGLSIVCLFALGWLLLIVRSGFAQNTPGSSVSH